MKRLFILFSNLLILTFLLWISYSSSDLMIHQSLPMVGVHKQEREVTHEQVFQNLSDLALESNSLIGRKIQETDDKGDVVFTYEIYGAKKPPVGIMVATGSSAANSSLLMNYYILSGDLSLDRLNNQLQSLGFSDTFVNNPNILSTFLTFMGNGAQSLAFVISVLTFSSLTIIQKNREMKSAGLKYISGIDLYRVFGQSILDDAKELVLATFLSISFGTAVIFFFKMTTFAYLTVAMSCFIYNFLLLLISIILSFLYTLSIRTVNLISLVKGKLPLRRILFLLFLGQFFAVILISLAIHRTSIYGNVWQLQQSGNDAWRQETNWITISTNRENTSKLKNIETRKELQEDWSVLIERGVSKGALLVYQNISNFTPNGFAQNPRNRKLMSINDYYPDANSLYVTPNYLDIQDVEVGEHIKKEFESFGEGDFGLLLPEKLRNQEKYYRQMYEEFLTIQEEKEKFPMKAHVFYTANNQKRFIYNITSLSYQQFLTDPIIVVIQPKNFGKHWNPFFTNSNHYIYFNGLDESKKLITEHKLEKYVSQYDYVYKSYESLSQKIRAEILVTISGGIFGIITSILLFNTMSFLYFEEFRKSILLKKIAGLTFLELHQKFLIFQSIVLIIGSLTSYMMMREIWISLVTLLFFGINAWLILLYRSSKEQTLATIILKGA